MANDRLFILCDHCGERFCLGKYDPSSGLGVDPMDKALILQLVPFIKYHVEVCQLERRLPADQYANIDMGDPICVRLIGETGLCTYDGGAIDVARTFPNSRAAKEIRAHRARKDNSD